TKYSNYLKLYDSKTNSNYVFFKKTISAGTFTFGDFSCPIIDGTTYTFTHSFWETDKVAYIQDCNVLNQATVEIMNKAYIKDF
ncbi:MAG: hypothetical protein QF535_09600, partial [Anaerolineales bacterium]|nr:hypothetical protein [Anaerolineales bacterium]